MLQDVISTMPQRLRLFTVNALVGREDKVCEITLRSGRPLCMYIEGQQYAVTEGGFLTQDYTAKNLLTVTSGDVTDTFNSVCNYSVYSHLNEIKEGYITLKGGHRCAISGTAVVNGTDIINIRDISTVSLRIAREIPGCGEKLTSEIHKLNGGLLLCGAPISGKTTVIRDVARLLSTEYNRRVSIVDSRGEISAAGRGKPQLNIGFCDVLDFYPRALGIEQSVRCLSPEYIICDEIGSSADVYAIQGGINSGVSFIATAHAGNVMELRSKENIMNLLSLGAFKKVVFLKGRSTPSVISETYGAEEILND